MNDSTNPIIRELEAMTLFKWTDHQQKFFNQQAKDARAINCVSLKTIFSSKELAHIKRVVRPVKHQCYRNSALLAELYPDRCKYVEGFGWNGICKVQHAWNKIDGKYIDLTWELCLKEDVTNSPYVALIEASSEEVVDDIVAHDNTTGDYYLHNYLRTYNSK